MPFGSLFGSTIDVKISSFICCIFYCFMSWEIYNPLWHVYEVEDGHPQDGLNSFSHGKPHEKLPRFIPCDHFPCYRRAMADPLFLSLGWKISPLFKKLRIFKDKDLWMPKTYNFKWLFVQIIEQYPSKPLCYYFKYSTLWCVCTFWHLKDWRGEYSISIWNGGNGITIGVIPLR